MVSQWQNWVQDPGLQIPNVVLFPNIQEELAFIERQACDHPSTLCNPLPQKHYMKCTCILQMRKKLHERAKDCSPETSILKHWDELQREYKVIGDLHPPVLQH